jgi:hypothetical protein
VCKICGIKKNPLIGSLKYSGDTVDLGARAMGWFGLSYLGVVAAATNMVNGFWSKYLHDPIG